MLSALREAVASPASFFEHEAADPGLRGPVLVVAALALAGVLSSIPVFLTAANSVAQEAQPFVLAGLGIGVIIGAFAPFVVWLIYTLLFYGLSTLFDGSGEFRDLFALVGWGFAPRVLASLVGTVVTLVLLPESGFADPQAAQSFANEMTTNPLGIANRIFGLLMTLWAAWIWTHAVAAGRDLSRRDAAITVGVVVGLGVLLDLGSTVLLPP